MDLHHPSLTSESIKEMSYVLMENQENCHEECEGSAGTREKSILAVYSDVKCFS